MKLLRRWYWFLSGFLVKYRMLIILGILIGASVYRYYDTIVKVLPFRDTSYIGQIGRYTLSNIPIDIQKQISQGLVRIAPDGSYQNELASSIKVSSDGLQYTVTLKEDLRWNDDTLLKAEDIHLNLPSNIEVQNIDDQTMKFVLSEAFAPFPLMLSQPVLRRTIRGQIFKRTSIMGTKAFKITNIKAVGNLAITTYVFKAKIDGKTAKESKDSISREFFKNNMSVLFSVN